MTNIFKSLDNRQVIPELNPFIKDKVKS